MTDEMMEKIGRKVWDQALWDRKGFDLDYFDDDIQREICIDLGKAALQAHAPVPIDEMPEEWVSNCAEDHVNLLLTYEDGTTASGRVFDTGEGNDYYISSNHVFHSSMVVTHVSLPPTIKEVK